MKNVWLVTGGAGYIGSHVVQELLSSGNEVVVLDDLSTGQASFVPSGAVLVRGSILDSKKIAKALKISSKKGTSVSIMHIAGLKLAGESMNDPEKYWRVNVQGTLTLLSEARKFKIERIVFSSSCSVYGTTGDTRVNESFSVNPESTYAKTKLVAEQIIQDFARISGIPTIALRYFNVAGTSLSYVKDLSKENLFPALLNSIIHEKEFIIHGNTYETRDGTCIRDYLHVADLAVGHRLAGEWLKGKEKIFEVFNLGTGTGTSVLEIVKEFNEQSANLISYSFGPIRIGDPASITADSTKATKVLGWQSSRSLSDMVSSALTKIEN